MKISLALFIVLFTSNYSIFFSQKKITITGGVDTYFGINPLDINQKIAPIYVSSNKLSSPAINLALIDFNYRPTQKLHFQFTPAYGTYMNANYAGEHKNLRWIYEGYLGIEFGKNKKQCLDAGIFSAPYTFETPKSWDQLMYTRSIAPEFVPYYLTGIRYKNAISEKLKLNLFLLNGWQKIEFQNKNIFFLLYN